MALSSYFLNTAGLATALMLLPFLLLYLIRPKPHHETIPSLLFIMKETGKSNVNSLFRTFLKDILFLLQLLILLAIIAAAARPYIEVPRTYLVEQTVLLVDVSGSMGAGDRFDEAIAQAKENLGKENTIILIKNAPDVLIERASASRAEEALDRLEPTATTTALSDALQLAGSYAGAGSRVVILSDFLPTQGDLDYDTIAATLEAKGAIVDYLPVGEEGENVGIVDLRIGPAESSVWIKNFNERPEEVTLTISEGEQELLLARGETKEVSFATPEGVAEISIKEADDLPLDNTAWVSAPEENQVSLLIITNERSKVEQSNLLLALDVISKNFPTEFTIEYAEPPKVPNLNHDIYLVTGAKLDFILPGYVRELEERVNEGASLILFLQEGLFAFDWQGLLPVTLQNESAGGRATIMPSADSPLTQDIQFGQLSSYQRVRAEKEGLVVAQTEQDPLIVLGQRGRGLILYYGFEDTQASFAKDPSYPVFWRRAFDLLTDRPSLANLNVRTGSIINLQQERPVKTPSGTVRASLIPVEEAGLYTLPDRTVAATMLSDRESNIDPPAKLTRTATADSEEQEERAPKELTHLFLISAIILLLLELLYVKYRGDF